MLTMATMKPYYENENGRLYNADCLEILPHLEPVDLVLTDPPYGLSFMGKNWDRGVPGPHFWESITAKPGCHLFAFGGTRTAHRLACAIEDAGWEIRDTMAWVYGSGFPKSLDVSKAIDKAAGAEREVVGLKIRPDGKAMIDARPNGFSGSHAGWDRPWKKDKQKVLLQSCITSPATDAARKWQGYGTALKPAYEPIIVARRPLSGTVANNVLEYGTGALNIDKCRVAHSEECRIMAPSQQNISNPSEKCKQAGRRTETLELKPSGRWPANFIHDGSEEVVGLFPDARSSGNYTRGEMGKSSGPACFDIKRPKGPDGLNDSGSAARFFYTAKASRRDRGEGNTHPTVKPFKLIRYLMRLGSRRGQLVLDPFCGSGTTAVVCESIGRKWVCIEISDEYCEIAAKRIEKERSQLKLF